MERGAGFAALHAGYKNERSVLINILLATVAKSPYLIRAQKILRDYQP
jgi:hypothetical protein